MSISRRQPICALLALLTFALAGLAPAAATTEFGRDYGGNADELPEELEGVDVEEKLGVSVPLEVQLRGEDGAPLELGSVFETGKPVILTFNYSNCPMLCSVQLGGLVDVLRQMKLQPGRQFKIVTVALDPTEGPEQLAKTKSQYLERVENKDEVAKGWRFVSGSDKTVRALADSVGFYYRYSQERNQYFHPPAMMVISPSGKLSSYVYGVSFEPEQITEAITAAALGDTRESAQAFVGSCFLYDAPDSFAAKAFEIMRIGGIGFVIVLAGGVGTARVVKKSRRRRAGQS